MGVVIVPLLDLHQDHAVIHRRALLPQLPVAALCPLLSAGGQVNLHICIRQDHCGNVPAVHDHVVLFGHIPLHIQQEVPHRRDLGHLGGAHRDLRQANLLRHVLAVEIHPLQPGPIVAHGNHHLRQQGCHGLGVLGVHALLPDAVRHRAVNGSCVHVEKSQFLGHAAGNAALPRPAGSVQRHRNIFLFF